MRKMLSPPALIVLIFILSAYAALFTVEQNQHAFVTQLGKPVGEPLEPGLHIKIPLIQRVRKLDNRLLNCPLTNAELMTLDKQKVTASFFAIWQITDPIEYLRGAGNRETALRQLKDVIGAELAVAFGKHSLKDLLTEHKGTLLKDTKEKCRETCLEFGVELTDLRLSTLSLSEKNRDVVYARMVAEFKRQAQRHRSAGLERKSQWEAKVDREKAALISEAQCKATSISGQAEAEASRIYAEAFGKDPEFFNLVQTLDVSRKILDEKSTLFLSPEYEFLNFFKQSGANIAE